jgi:hypothetical protein
MPASVIADRASGLIEAGPMVQTILAFTNSPPVILLTRRVTEPAIKNHER